MDLDLSNTKWDCCLVGNGAAALWMSHWLWSNKKSVLWITTEEPYSSERALLQHGWLWGLKPEHAALLRENLRGFGVTHDEALAGSGLDPAVFEVIYYDARSSKRFRRFGDAKQEFGAHEKEYFTALGESVAKGGPDSPESYVDFWNWHAKLHRFHDQGPAHGPTKVELFSEPRFVRLQNWPILELKTTAGKLSGVVLAGRGSFEITATEFYLADFDEPLQTLVKNHDDSEQLAAALKGKTFRAGFGLRLAHKPEFLSYPSQTAVVPLVVNPEKDQGSHVVGRFFKREEGVESFWMGFLTDEELEDNNEILKKIKQAKRAIDRAIAGFSESIARETVSFEPRLRALDLVKTRRSRVLGANLLSDHYGPEAAAESVKHIFTGL